MEHFVHSCYLLNAVELWFDDIENIDPTAIVAAKDNCFFGLAAAMMIKGVTFFYRRVRDVKNFAAVIGHLTVVGQLDNFGWRTVTAESPPVN